jgi:hypothetical protein
MCFVHEDTTIKIHYYVADAFKLLLRRAYRAVVHGRIWDLFPATHAVFCPMLLYLVCLHVHVASPEQSECCCSLFDAWHNSFAACECQLHSEECSCSCLYSNIHQNSMHLRKLDYFTHMLCMHLLTAGSVGTLYLSQKVPSEGLGQVVVRTCARIWWDGLLGGLHIAGACVSPAVLPSINLVLLALRRARALQVP